MSAPRTVSCRKLGIEAEGLPQPPLPGELGERIYQQISAAAWQQWLDHQTMLINEKRLVLRDPTTRVYLREQMALFLFGGEVEQPAGYVAPDGRDES